jgi:hypothetical protein
LCDCDALTVCLWKFSDNDVLLLVL